MVWVQERLIWLHLIFLAGPEVFSLSYLITWCLWHFDIQWTREDGVPAGADVSLTIHWWKKGAFYTLNTRSWIYILYSKVTARCLTGDAFLQAVVESAQANLVQQTGVESLEGLHVFQTFHNYVNIFPRALCWSGGMNRRGQHTGRC